MSQVDAVAQKIAQLEAFGDSQIEATAILCSSGMSAISTISIALLKAGDKILTQGNLYGGTTELFVKILQPLGIEIIMTDLSNLQKVNDILQKDNKIKVLYFETPSNPTMDCLDISGLCDIAKKHALN